MLKPPALLRYGGFFVFSDNICFMSKERVLILIDGSNFYFSLKKLGLPKYKITEFNFGKFVQWLANGRQVTGRNYYVGVVRAKPNDNKGQELRRDQQRLFAHLRSKQNKFVTIHGYLMKSDEKYHEKGVDVRMAVDLVVGAFEDKFDSAILISSDTDLIPAIKHVQKRKKKVEYIGFSSPPKSQPSYGLIKTCSQSRVLVAADIKQFITRQ